MLPKPPVRRPKDLEDLGYPRTAKKKNEILKIGVQAKMHVNNFAYKQ